MYENKSLCNYGSKIFKLKLFLYFPWNLFKTLLNVKIFKTTASIELMTLVQYNILRLNQ